MYVCASVCLKKRKLNRFSTLCAVYLCAQLALVWELHFNTLQSISTIRNVTIITASIFKYRIDELRPDNAKKNLPYSTPQQYRMQVFLFNIKQEKVLHFRGACFSFATFIAASHLQFACNISNKENKRNDIFYAICILHILYYFAWNVIACARNKERAVCLLLENPGNALIKSIHRIKSKWE